MTGAHPNWNSLPLEILQNIFRQARTKDQRNFAFVCKSWLHPAQALVYSCIIVDTLPKLKRFYEIVKNYPHLGEKVKIFHLIILTNQIENASQPAARVETFNILSALLYTYLPNLEQLGGDTLLSHLPVLRALLDSKLMRLKKLAKPNPLRSGTGEVSNYITCSLLMKDRLENIFISDRIDVDKSKPSDELLYFNDLYHKLDQFENLAEIDIRRNTTEEIKELEYITEGCQYLKKITISMDAISKFAPRSNVDSLNINLTVSEDYKNLLYIMHKFPQLRRINLNIVEENSCKLNYSLLSRLFKYLSKISHVYATDLTADHDTITKSFEKLWNTKSKFGTKEVQLDYSDYYSEVNLGLRGNGVYISYPLPGLEWRHRDFLEENGKYIEQLELSFKEDGFDYTERIVFPEDTFNHTLTHCPNLRSLIFQKVNFEEPRTRSKLDEIEVTALDSLTFDNCTIGFRVINRLALYLYRIDSLHLMEVKSGTGEHRYRGQAGTEILRIDMPETEIYQITLNYNISTEEPLYLQLYEKDEMYYYYQYNPSVDTYRKELTQEEYMKVGSHRYIYICCATKPRIDIE